MRVGTVVGKGYWIGLFGGCGGGRKRKSAGIADMIDMRYSQTVEDADEGGYGYGGLEANWITYQEIQAILDNGKTGMCCTPSVDISHPWIEWLSMDQTFSRWRPSPMGGVNLHQQNV